MNTYNTMFGTILKFWQNLDLNELALYQYFSMMVIWFGHHRTAIGHQYHMKPSVFMQTLRDNKDLSLSLFHSCQVFSCQLKKGSMGYMVCQEKQPTEKRLLNFSIGKGRKHVNDQGSDTQLLQGNEATSCMEVFQPWHNAQAPGNCQQKLNMKDRNLSMNLFLTGHSIL